MPEADPLGVVVALPVGVPEAEAPVDTAVGRLETVIPALAQIFSTAGESSVRLHFSSDISTTTGEGDVPAISSAEHLPGTHAVMEAVMVSRPVVHWHSVSVSEHPASGTAVAKQGSYMTH